MLAASQAEAARHPHYHAHAHHAAVGFAPALVNESIVIDVETGQILSQVNADAITYPASLTKMMTLYLTFEALNASRLRLDQYLPVSYEAASRAPTKLGLKSGESIAVQDLILGLVTRSANDAASVLAEGLAGSEPVFAEHMTRMTRQLGMTSTVYRNASGLPDPDQYTTARDQAQLALALYRDFPREYRYFSTRQFYFRGNIIHNHNHLLDWYEGAGSRRSRAGSIAPLAREAWNNRQSRLAARSASIPRQQGRGGTAGTRAAYPAGRRALEHPASRLSRRERGREGRSRRRQPSRSQE